MIRALLWAAIAAVVLTGLARAQVPGPEQYTLTVTPQELEQIGDAITYLPKRTADPLLNKLARQMQDQRAAASEAAKKAADEAKKAQEPVKQEQKHPEQKEHSKQKEHEK